MCEDTVELYPQEDGTINVSLPCGDIFAWSSADSQNVTLDNLPILEKALKDVLALSPYYKDDVYRKDHPIEWATLARKLGSEVSVIFACRVRNIRPLYHDNSYGVSARLNPLIEAIKK